MFSYQTNKSTCLGRFHSAGGFDRSASAGTLAETIYFETTSLSHMISPFLIPEAVRNELSNDNRDEKKNDEPRIDRSRNY
jgi:hypothetical protein